ncbi:MAG: UDP-N-acetylglucosamine 2-epimerase (non-hydrolyzing) [Pseudomonadota bacterium]
MTRATKFALVVGTRPNFMKAAPLIRALESVPRFQSALVHTGQHYDHLMSNAFVKDLSLPEPDVNLNVGSSDHGAQTGLIMIHLEEYLKRNPPDCLVVVGDVNSTMAGALVASKMQLPIAHVEAGCRSFDRTMPEEINRLVTDALSDILFTADPYGDRNLVAEGHSKEKIHRVGNIMIDTVVEYLPMARKRCAAKKFGLQGKPYVVTTIHRPSNADHLDTLESVLLGLADVSRKWPVVFPVHPRTRVNIDHLRKKLDLPDSLIFSAPLSYLDMLSLTCTAVGLLTDSGGLQAEAAYLKVPALTVRPNTEWMVTIDCGTNRLVRSERNAISAAAQDCFRSGSRGTTPELWDGHASERIVDLLQKLL